VSGNLAGSGDHASFALVLESEALTVDPDYERAVEDSVEHRCGEHTVAGEERAADDEERGSLVPEPPDYGIGG